MGTPARDTRVFIQATCLLVLTVAFPMLGITGCTEYRDNGELVRHHFGYVKVVTPAVHAPNAAVRVLDVETYGVWFAVDGRPADEDANGYGTGIGYQHDRREFIPLDCRMVVRVQDAKQIEALLDALRARGISEKGICAVQDTTSVD